ncbi:39S ribosomal protein L11, mitochondrial [Portunus trituberculatus]|uniref:39S ribosomal protein L11, mitochondrial n=1 Tax=Portunus trituberculatus TaxID=210409 RepID=A0A5B7EGA9_PORTR|nr:39S ribosomal protein L11, mitochondrial [Portunus trituberculatus]
MGHYLESLWEAHLNLGQLNQVVRDLDAKEYEEFLNERKLVVEEQQQELQEKKEANQTYLPQDHNNDAQQEKATQY